jgi:hypothetical protein
MRGIGAQNMPITVVTVYCEKCSRGGIGRRSKIGKILKSCPRSY